MFLLNLKRLSIMKLQTLAQLVLCFATRMLEAAAHPTEMTCLSIGAPRPNDPHGPEKAENSVYMCKN